MKFLHLLSLASGTTMVGALFLEQNVLCGDSQSCARDCRNSQYHVVQDDAGTAFFGCSLTNSGAGGTSKWDVYKCNFGAIDNVLAGTKSREVCAAANGRLCPVTLLMIGQSNYCITRAQNRATHKAACEADGGTQIISKTDLSYQAATVNCPNS